jgi:hypothetical protein
MTSYNLTILERMVLETLQLRGKKLSEISENTSVEKNLLNQIIQSLLCKGLIKVEDKKYFVNTILKQEIKNELSDSVSLMSEVNEIINSCLRKAIQNESKTSFKLKKVNMSEREEKIYKGLVYNMESFLSSLNKTENIKDQKIVFWGEGNYEDIKNNIINY